MPAFTLNKRETACKQIQCNRNQYNTQYNIAEALFIVENEQAGQEVLININQAEYLVVFSKSISEYEEQKAHQQNGIFSLTYVKKYFSEQRRLHRYFDCVHENGG